METYQRVSRTQNVNWSASGGSRGPSIAILQNTNRPEFLQIQGDDGVILFWYRQLFATTLKGRRDVNRYFLNKFFGPPLPIYGSTTVVSLKWQESLLQFHRSISPPTRISMQDEQLKKLRVFCASVWIKTAVHQASSDGRLIFKSTSCWSGGSRSCSSCSARRVRRLTML